MRRSPTWFTEVRGGWLPVWLPVRPLLRQYRGSGDCSGAGRYLAEHIPGAKYVELSGDDHIFFVGEGDALLDEIEEFLTGSHP